MRPIEKKCAGDTVRYSDSRNHEIVHVILENYDPYGEAKLPLVGNLERYCSYCESLRELDALEVEHRVARNNGGDETKWENFLLCCKVCNTVKSAKEVDEDMHWPHRNNTFLDFVYDETGRVKINPALPEQSRLNAQKLYDLVHLERNDMDATPKDYRWMRRYETWNKAQKARIKFESGKWDADDVVERAKDTGHWSVWFTVFEGIDTILSRLISDFAGTCSSCFDPHNHYRPIPRNPDNPVDPV